MIPFDFDYYRPETIDEAISCYKDLDAQERSPLYYGGGTEIISMARMNNIFTKAVIDLKEIPETNALEIQGADLVIGSSVTLSTISESKVFPLLGKACGRIADHTIQCKITIGGNISGTIIYREAALPLLLTDCDAIVAGSDGIRRVTLREIFDGRLRLNQNEFIVKFIIAKEYLDLPYVHVKKTKNEKIDYPLVSLAALKKDDQIRVAFSGVCSGPFRSVEMETELNQVDIPSEKRVLTSIDKIPFPLLNDLSGSNEFRKFVLQGTLENTLQQLEEV